MTLRFPGFFPGKFRSLRGCFAIGDGAGLGMTIRGRIQPRLRVPQERDSSPPGMLRDRFAQNDTGYEIPPLQDATRSRSLGITIRGRIEDEHARPLLSQYLETAGRGDFISYGEESKDWELK